MMMQQKNLLAFATATLLLLTGWLYLQYQLRLNLPPVKDADNQGKLKEKSTADPVRVKNASAGVATVLSGASHLAGLRIATLAAHLLPAPVAPPIIEVRRELQFGEDKQLGGKDFFINATLTTKGAAVKKLILTKFKGADRLGEPTHKDLELIQEDKYAPSFRLFHFSKPNADQVEGVLGQIPWKFESEQKPDEKAASAEQLHTMTFSTHIPEQGFEHIKITKTYSLKARDYHIGLTLEFEDTRTGKGSATPFRYQLAGGHGLPIEGWWYTYTYRNSLIGEVDGRGNLWRNFQESRTIAQQGIGDRVPMGELGDNFLRYAGVAVQYFSSTIVVDDDQPDKGKDILAWARPTVQTQETPGRIMAIDAKTNAIDFVSRKGERFTFQLLPRAANHVRQAKLQANEDVVATWYRTEGVTVCTWIERGTLPHVFLNDILVRVNSKTLELQPQDKVTHKFLLYHGPNKVRLLSQLENYPAAELVERYAVDLHLRTLTDYQSPGWVGAFSQAIRLTDLLIAITSLMHGLIHLLHYITPNYGLTIILLTIVVRGLMFPISRRQAVLSIRMQELAPEMKKLQDKYKNDPQGRNQAVMELYRKHNVHPFGMCLPLVLQMPIFLGLYYALQESVHLRLASFLWVSNLAAPDMTMYWTESIPIISDPDSHGGILYLGPFLNILPIAAVTLMVIQQKLFTPPPTDEQQEATQRMMKYMMIFMGIMFYKIAAGLCIYFIASSLWGLAERQLLPKKKPATALGPTSGPPDKSSKQLPPRKPRPGDKGKGKDKEEKKDGTLDKMKAWWANVLEQARKK